MKRAGVIEQRKRKECSGRLPEAKTEIDKLQDVLFVLDSFEQLFDAARVIAARRSSVRARVFQ